MSESTGMRCLPSTKLANADGNVLHDWHAETLAIRAFNRYLADECLKLASGTIQQAAIICRRKRSEAETSTRFRPFALRADVKLVMYCSETPCGDASMELVMEAQEDASPWPTEASTEQTSPLLGRGSFSQLGIVRRKPARRDSPPTASKSCSDKLALKQCLSLLSTPLLLLVDPEDAYLARIIIPRRQYRRVACERAFGISGRMSPIAPVIRDQTYGLRPFEVGTTDVEFEFSRAKSNASAPPKGCTVSVVWTPDGAETVVNGVLMGRRQSDPAGRSKFCRREILKVVTQVARLEEIPCVPGPSCTYQQWKQSEVFKIRRAAKVRVTREALKGWHPNEEDDFSLENS